MNLIKELGLKIEQDEIGNAIVKHSNAAQNSAERLKNFIDNLLSLALLNNENKQFEQFNPQLVLTDLLSDIDHLVKNKGVKIYYDLPDTLTGNKIQFRALLQNLIINSIKHNNENEVPFIKITATASNNMFNFVLSDNGKGIPKKDWNNIFKPFKIASNSNKKVTESTVLGLYICQKIIKAHGGEIWVDKDDLNAPGINFNFTIKQ